MPAKLIKLTLLLLGICVLSAAPVFADSTGFTFVALCATSSPCALNSAFPSPHPWTKGSITVTTSAYHMLTTGDLEPLFMKDLPASGGDTETGLGTAFSGNPTHEIQGNNWIQVDISKIAHLSGVTLSIDSIQTGDSYNIFVSSTPGTVGTDEIFRRDTDHLVTITGAEIGTNSFIDVTAFSGNVLLEDATVSTTSVPEPGSAGLLLIGLGALVAAGTLGKKLIA